MAHLDFETRAEVQTGYLDAEGSPVSMLALANLRHYLESLPDRDRELLDRFYLQRQDENTIIREMNVTEADLALARSNVRTLPVVKQ